MMLVAFPESMPCVSVCEAAYEYRALAGDRPDFWKVRPGTGGAGAAKFWASKYGYSHVIVRDEVPEEVPVSVQLMAKVKAGFGRTFAHLPAVFGVSRQTLYNWANGSAVPRDEYQDRLRQLAAAADILGQSGIRLSASTLERPLLEGKSFLQLLGEGGEGAKLAEKLVRLERRGAAASSQIDAMLAGQSSIQGSSVADYSAPALNEEL